MSVGKPRDLLSAILSEVWLLDYNQGCFAISHGLSLDKDGLFEAIPRVAVIEAIPEKNVSGNLWF